MTTITEDSLPPPGRIVVLNGPSSSGKTSLARAVQRRLPAPHQHLQLDAFRAMEPAGYWDGWEQRDPAAVALQLAAMCRAMNAALIEYSRHGQHVIFDMALTNRDAWRHLLDDLAGRPVWLVGVTCAVAELSRRELQRGDRLPGLAAGQAARLHRDKVYDFMVDTSEGSPDECAARLVDWLAESPPATAFDAMRARLGAA